MMSLFHRTGFSPLPNIKGELPVTTIAEIASNTPIGSHSHLSLDIPVGSSLDKEIEHVGSNQARQDDFRVLVASRAIFDILLGDFQSVLSPTRSTAVAVIDIHHGDVAKQLPHADDWHSDVAIGENTIVGAVATESPTQWLEGKYSIKRKKIVPHDGSIVHTFEPEHIDSRPLLSVRDFNIHRRSEELDPKRVFIIAGLLLTSD
jgi:hypothetical protein